MSYAIEILRVAQKQLSKIERMHRLRIVNAIRSLGTVPRPPGCKKLSGRPAFRIRVGNYRVIYEIHDSRLLVIVITIGDRKEIYR